MVNQLPAVDDAAPAATGPSPSIEVVFHALADPTRRAMVDRLIGGPASVSELARPLAMSLPAVVQHLHVLERSGLVRSEKLGRVRTCHVQAAALGAAERWIAERRAAWEQRLDRLGAYLDETAAESAPPPRSHPVAGPRAHPRPRTDRRPE
jgi:DNA-binding transcriptional ArsR family regulator